MRSAEEAPHPREGPQARLYGPGRQKPALRCIEVISEPHRRI
nr:MAG TPA: hypothetical protein [Caudoviricetes sp.]